MKTALLSSCSIGEVSMSLAEGNGRRRPGGFCGRVYDSDALGGG